MSTQVMDNPLEGMEDPMEPMEIEGGTNAKVKMNETLLKKPKSDKVNPLLKRSKLPLFLNLSTHAEDF